MRHVAVLMVVVLVGCDDPVGPLEQEPYGVTTLRAPEEDTEVTFVDLNENGQALWHEGEQAVLWDKGVVLDIPVGRFLGSSGEVLGASSLWRGGELIELPGRTEGIHEDGTVYISRNDTLFTWREGTLTATDRPIGRFVGPEGRIWSSKDISNPPYTFQEECGFYQDGDWHGVFAPEICFPIMAEENAWVILEAAGGTNPGRYVFGPQGYGVLARERESDQAHIVHVNSEGRSVTEDGFVAWDGGEKRLDLWEHFDSIRPGAINDDGAILAQLNDEVVLLTPK